MAITWDKDYSLDVDGMFHADWAANGGALGDNYLKFVVDELKPFVDRNFRTLPDRENTFMMGKYFSTSNIIAHLTPPMISPNIQSDPAYIIFT